MVRVVLDPRFKDWLEELATADHEIFAEVVALINAIDEHGRLGDPHSHPVVTSRFDLHALRRTPATDLTPYATGPPVIRILYAYAMNKNETVAVVLLGGDKTDMQNNWYPANINTAEHRLEQWCRNNNHQAIIKRGGL